MTTFETKTISIFSGTVCLIALCALVGMFYVVHTKDAAYEAALQLRATRIAAAKELASLDRLVADTADDRQELADHILTEDSVVGFLSLIENLGRARGVTTETRSLAVEAIKGSDLFEQLTLEVNVTGSFAAVANMLPLLETLPYQLQVRAAILKVLGEDNLWRGAYRMYVTKYK